MCRKLTGKIVLVTGAGGLIGSDTAILFAREGATVVVNDINGDKAEKVAQCICQSGGSAVPVIADVSSGVAVNDMFTLVRERFKRLDVLVNNAYAEFNDVELADVEESDWDRTIAVCLKGPFLCAKQAVRIMRDNGGGSVIWISSVNALVGIGATAYTAAKGGLISLARLVAAKYGRFHIRSNVICPGTILPAEHMSNVTTTDSRAGLESFYPIGRVGTPQDIAQYALFLASEESAFVTGAVHVVDGGLTSLYKLPKL